MAYTPVYDNSYIRSSPTPDYKDVPRDPSNLIRPMTLFDIPCRLSINAPLHEIVIHPILLGDIETNNPIEDVRKVFVVQPSS